MSVQIVSAGELSDGTAELDPAQPDTAPWALRSLAVAAVCLGVAALAAATFVLSYSPIRAVALQAGITPRLARSYPLLLDAMLIIALAAVLALRGAGLPSRLLAWVTLLLVMAVAAGADALHAAGRSIPHQAAAITAAVLPFVLVLIAFTLLLVMLRYARLRRLADAVPLQRGSVTVSGFAADVGAAAPERPHPELAMHADPAADDPSTDEGVSEPATGTTPYPAESQSAGGYDEADDAEPDDGSAELEDLGPAPIALTEEEAEPDEPDGPVFHRLFSAPTPPPEV